MTAKRRELPEHFEETLEAIGRLHTEHYRGTTPLQRRVNRVTAIIGQPISIALLAAAVFLWVSGNFIATITDHHAWDPAPFSVLQAVATIAALFFTVLILVTQRHADELDARREQLILQLTMLTDQKSAKIIELLEEMRRDDPLLVNRKDSQAEAMSKPTSPHEVIDAIKDAEQTQMSSAEITTVETSMPKGDLGETPTTEPRERS